MTTTANEMAVANTILAQLGGHRACVMIGAKAPMGTANSLSLRFAAKAKNKANHVEITLDPSDTYTVAFYKIGRLNCDKLSETSMVHADSLRSLFTAETGLYLSL